jgi:CRP-like cAMP-binding protein
VFKAIRFKAGEVILRENEPGETAYVIERGRVEVTREDAGRRTHLAYLGEGEPFGEMGMIEEKPRSATVTAVEDTVVREIHRDDFFRSLKADPNLALSLLRALFERLREAGSTIVRLQQAAGVPAATTDPAATGVVVDTAGTAISSRVLFLTGLTPQAEHQLPSSPFRIDAFPFRIGRKSPDPLVMNDLSLADFMPFQISRHHVALVCEGGRFGVLDRGSQLGALVDGRPVGGREGAPGPAFFEKEEGTLVLGNARSPFRFKVVIGAADDDQAGDG